MINKNICKSEKGSITLFVLVCMLFICIILLGFYLSSVNSNNAQLKEIESIKDQYISQEDIDDIYYSNIKYVAQINNVKYRTLREAIEAVKTDETILMIGDTTENNTVPEGKKFTLDLGEQTITGGIVNNGDLIIKGNGTIICNKNYEKTIKNELLGNLIINGGIFRNEKANTIIENDGNFTMNTGKLIKDKNDGYNVINNGITNINGGEIIFSYTNDHLEGAAIYNSSGSIVIQNSNVTSTIYGLVVDGGTAKTTGGTITSTTSL